MKQRKIFLIVVCILCIGVLPSCNKNNGDEKNGKKSVVYYVNSDETKLISTEYILKETELEAQIRELLDALDQEPKSIKKKRVKPECVQVEKIALKENGQLTLYFNDQYSVLNGVSEVLCRSAIVKMLCQLDGVDCVQFYVGGLPLMYSPDKAVGFERAEDFIDNTGGQTNFYQREQLTLFFANKRGNALVEKHVAIDYDGTVPMEQLILQYLQNGLSLGVNLSEDEVQETIPKNAKIVKTAIRDDICYVYFDSGFMEKMGGMKDKVVIYSIVNSLCEMPNVDKVQFMIDGKQVPVYREKIKLDSPFERNLDLVQGNV